MLCPYELPELYFSPSPPHEVHEVVDVEDTLPSPPQLPQLLVVVLLPLPPQLLHVPYLGLDEQELPLNEEPFEAVAPQ